MTQANKRPSLFGSTSPERPPRAAQPNAPETPEGAPRGRKDREDKRQIAGFFSPECAKQMRILAAEADTTVQELLREALNLMFQGRGKPPIA
ncbi:MAG: hypothetical protein JOY71_13265 [Acetobacteraceae bacterium]|nr:hypothetical protein [Acetobacteraceae bacterium]MBV8523070.1 hypothetical protein [Acetobacteraceae bacterium]